MEKPDLASVYCSLLEDIRKRLRLVRNVVDGSLDLGSEVSNYEFVSVQLRKCLEMIAFGSLSANQPEYEKVHANFREHWNARRMLATVRKVNPGFYPKPVFVAKETPGPTRQFHFDYVKEGFLTESELVELYDHCSKVIHARNPFADWSTIHFRLSVSAWTDRIEALLRLHLIRLSGSQTIWLARLQDIDGRAHVATASPT